jgi:phenylacetate-CoA ligase
MTASVLELVRAFGRTFAQTEWLSPEKLCDYQAPLISKLLRHARQTTDFYRDRFEFDLDSADEIKKNWSAIPVFTRAEAVANRERLFSRSVPPEAGAIEEGETSGSTGIPLSYRHNQISGVALLALTERMLRWWKVDGAKPYARIAFDSRKIAPPPQGATFGRWHSAHTRGSHYFLSSTADVRTQIRWIAARKPAYLGAYGSLLKEIARECRRSETKLEFELLFSFGTIVDEETRELCRSVFGVEIADTYGAMEAGHFAAQCPLCAEYHVSAEAAHVEVLRDDGSAAGDGEMGRVVVTSLYGYAMPLIRYEIGDLAEVGSERALCGRGLPSLRRILGRYRNLFRFRDGTTVWPWPNKFEEFIQLKQYQVVQTDLDHIEILYVPKSADQPVDIAALTECVRNTLGQPVGVTLRVVDSIPRSRSGKYEDFISLVPTN